MALVLTIAGVTKAFQADTLYISASANTRATASLAIQSADATYRPSVDAEVIITEDGIRRFGGLIDRATERGSMGTGYRPNIVTDLSVVDFNAYADRRIVNTVIPTGTVKAALTVLVTQLVPFGVTLDAGQVDGPTLPDLTFAYVKLSDCLQAIATLTAEVGEPYVSNIDEFKVLSMFQPSTKAAPFNLTATAAQVVGDITVEATRDDRANRIIVRVPEVTQTDRIESFAGDGTTSTFNVLYTVIRTYGIVHVLSGGGETLTIAPDTSGQWTYDASTKTLTRNIGPSVAGETYNFMFDGTYSAQAIAEDAADVAAYGYREIVVTLEAVQGDAAVQAFAEAELAKRTGLGRTVRYQTREAGLVPGQTQSIIVPSRNLSGTALISDVITRDFGGKYLMRDVAAIMDTAQTNLGRGWRDVYKQWSKTGGGAATATVTGSGEPSPGGGAAAPLTSVQFNRGGALGGNAAFTYIEAGNSLVVGGGGSSITATSPESCVVCGYNCHIEDP